MCNKCLRIICNSPIQVNSQCEQCCNPNPAPVSPTSNQNNRVIEVPITSTFVGTPIAQLVYMINTSYTFTVPEDVNVIFTLTLQGGTDKVQFLFNPGKGTYGFNTIRLVNTTDFTQILIPTSGPAITPDILVNTIGLTMNKKKGESSNYTRTQQMLPEGETTYSTRNGFIGNTLPIANSLTNEVEFAFGETLYETKIQNLWLKVEGWNYIKDYNPQLIITRYRYTENKNTDNAFPLGGNHYRKGGFKLNNGIDNGSPLLLRPSKIPLTTQYPIIDFGQEHYFKAKTEGVNSQMLARGNSKHNKIVKGTGDNIPFIYFELRMQITVDSVDYMSKGLMRFKMEFRPDTYNKLEVILREV